MRRPTPSGLFTTFLVTACAGLAALTLILARENRSLKSQRAPGGATDMASLQPGAAIEPFPVVDASERVSTIRFQGEERKTVVFVYSSTCPACQQTLPLWRAVLDSTTPKNVRLLAVRTDASSTTTCSNGDGESPLPVPIYTPEPSNRGVAGRVPGVPAALVLDRDGVITKVWLGIPTAEDLDELRREMTI